MCGIAGFSGDFPQGLLTEFEERLRVRGPDGSGQIHLRTAHSSVGLAHSRLSIVDLNERSNQPMTTQCAKCRTFGKSAESSLWLTFNGEIYDYKKIRNQLASSGHTLSTESDSEVVLHLYADKGPEFVRNLNGMFALAIYDGREEGRREGVLCGDLVVARDALGIKPLYYSELREGFLFASEIKTLMAYSAIPKDLNFEALESYLSFVWAAAPATPFLHVKKFEPGEVRIVRNGRTCVIRRNDELTKSDYVFTTATKNCIDQMIYELESSVKRQTVADVNVGAFLSGGLDSSAIVAMMRRLTPDKPITCFTASVGSETQIEGCPQDLPYARKVAKAFSLDLKEVEIEPPTIGDLYRMVYTLDEPIGDPSALNIYKISDAAKQAGVKVLLSGVGGDDLFSGYRKHFAVEAERFWTWTPLALRKRVATYSRRLNRGSKLRLTSTHLSRRVMKALAVTDLSPDERLATYYFLGSHPDRREFFQKDIRDSLAENGPRSKLVQSLKEAPMEYSQLEKMLYLDVKHFLGDHNLVYTDKMSMSCGVEVRVPFLDQSIIAFARTLSPSLKQRGREGKFILKRAMEGILPKEVIHRKKTGFGAPLRNWIRNDLRNLVDDVLSTQTIKKRGIFDPKAVRKLIHENANETVDAGYTIFGLMCVELWCQRYLDGGTMNL